MEKLKGSVEDALSDSEARDWIYKYAKKKGVKITEFHSKGIHFCHLEGERHKTSTSCAKNQTVALLIAFLNHENKEFTFV